MIRNCETARLRSKPWDLESLWLNAQSKAQALRHQPGKQAFVKKMRRTSVLKEFVKSLRYTGMNSFPHECLLFESYQLYIKPATVVNLGQICQTCFLLQVNEISEFSVLAIFEYTWQHGLLLHYGSIAVKNDVHWKIFVTESVYITIQTSKYLNVNINAFYRDVYSTVEVFPQSRTGCYFGAFKLFS